MSSTNGWIPEVFDPNDKPYRSLSNKPVEKNVNLAEKYPARLGPVYDQSSSQSCVANATSAAYRYLARKIFDDTQVPAAVDDPSRLFVYYNSRALPSLEKNKQWPQVKDSGSWNRAAFKSINLFGVCAESTWPWGDLSTVNTKPGDDAYEEAKSVHVVEYCRLDPDHPAIIEQQLTDKEREAVGIVTLAKLKQCLSEGYPVVFGFWYYWEYPPWVKDRKDGVWVLPELPECQKHKPPPKVWDPEKKKYFSNGGHAVLCIGFDEATQMVLCQNSWGTGPEGWGSAGGLFWMAYSWITDWEATDDFWMIRLVNKPQTTPPAQVMYTPEIDAIILESRKTVPLPMIAAPHYIIDGPVGFEKASGPAFSSFTKFPGDADIPWPVEIHVTVDQRIQGKSRILQILVHYKDKDTRDESTDTVVYGHKAHKYGITHTHHARHAINGDHKGIRTESFHLDQDERINRVVISRVKGVGPEVNHLHGLEVFTSNLRSHKFLTCDSHPDAKTEYKRTDGGGLKGFIGRVSADDNSIEKLGVIWEKNDSC